LLGHQTGVAILDLLLLCGRLTARLGLAPVVGVAGMARFALGVFLGRAGRGFATTLACILARGPGVA
jgi:hypothetical protein